MAPSSPAGYSLEQRYKYAVSLYRNGLYLPALVQAEQIIAGKPTAAPVLNLAAVCARALAQLEKAEKYCREAIKAQPRYANAFNNLGLVLSDLMRYEEAEDCFLQAIGIQPELAETFVNLGNLFRATRRPREAEQSYRECLAKQPEHSEALYNLGSLMMNEKRATEAMAAFLKALEIRPNQPVVYNDLGNILMESLRFSEAEAAYRRAISLSPEYADAHFNLAILHMEQRRAKEAWLELEHCLELQPDHSNALNALGNLLAYAGRLDEGEKVYRRALECKPGSAIYHSNLGTLLMESERLAEAEAEFRYALLLEPDYSYALGQASSCASQMYSWSQSSADEASILSGLAQGAKGIPSRIVMALPNATAQHQLQAAELASGDALRSFQGRPPLYSTSPRTTNDRIHLGYLSADFHEHAVMHLLAGVLESHDRRQFKLHAYSMGANTGDRYRQRAEQCVEVFRDIQNISNAEAANLIVADQIDILIDLAGHTKNSRMGITAFRPSPVIVNWLGYPATLGQTRLADYIIGDTIATPADQASYFSETLAQMPNCCLPNDCTRIIGKTPSRAEEGLPDDAFVFSNFNQAFKLTPETFDIWCRMLREIPGSILWMAAPQPPGMDNLRKEAIARGVDPRRIFFAGRKADIAEHLGHLALADLALDTYPYTSHSTGCDMLWSGVPLITRMGSTFTSRIAGSMLHAVGLPELVTNSWEEYFNLAHQLANRPEMLGGIREKLSRNRLSSPLFDTAKFTTDIELLYIKMWEQYLGGVRKPILK